ncbi:MAG: hypothetical protein ACRERV_03225 [Methylococcales bacterium]
MKKARRKGKKTRIKYSFQTRFMTIPPMLPIVTFDPIEVGRLGRRIIEANFEGRVAEGNRLRLEET